METMSNRKILITGGAGFIGSALTRYLIAETDEAGHEVSSLDALFYASNPLYLVSETPEIGKDHVFCEDCSGKTWILPDNSK